MLHFELFLHYSAGQPLAQTQKAKQIQFRNLASVTLEPSANQDESSESSNMSEDVSLNRTSSLEKLTSSSTYEKDQAQRTFSDGFSKAEKRKHLNHPTFFDIAVIRCLFNPNWAEKGVKWALKYLNKRFAEIRDLELSGTNRRATRSHSTPVPIIKAWCPELTIYDFFLYVKSLNAHWIELYRMFFWIHEEHYYEREKITAV